MAENGLLGQVGGKLVAAHGLDQVVAGTGEKGLESGSRANRTCLQIRRGMWEKEDVRVTPRLVGREQGSRCGDAKVEPSVKDPDGSAE